MVSFEELLKIAAEKKASDIHLGINMRPVLRIKNRLVQLPFDPFSFDELKTMLEGVLDKVADEDMKEQLKRKGDLDFPYSLPGISRFRVNFYRQRGTLAAAVRLIPEHAPTIKELGFPEVLMTLAKKPSGLVIVTGATGSGKSTTLSAMLDYINTERSAHIITLEDPIEYLHPHKKSIVNQRELHTDIESFASGLKASLREDPDVILVGEMRDLDTISVALTAAETGHLVMTTLHTNNASQAIERIIDSFPSHQQQQARTQLALVLQGVICQQLIPKSDETGMIAALEILVANSAIKNLIREGKTHQIQTMIQSGADIGMRTMDNSLLDLYRLGVISYDEIANRITDTDKLFATKGAAARPGGFGNFR